MGAGEHSRVAVGMSGGVDSSVAASLLVGAGYDVIGITAIMCGEVSRCCSAEDVERAREVSARLGIAHHVVDVGRDFEERVIHRFVESYVSGRTPSPCVVCNETIKFGVLRERAMALGASHIATGHYAQVVEDEGGSHLVRGVDPAKDQSYFLARLDQEQLAGALFPLGRMVKSDVSAVAVEQQLMARKSKESQELCFVESGTHGDWIDLRVFDSPLPGPIVTTSGEQVGEHRGVHHYTIGQRKGLGIALGHPVYVTAIDAATRTITVGERSDVMSTQMTVEDVRWPCGPPLRDMLCCQVRYNHRAAECRVEPESGDTCRVVFSEPQFALTSGQLAVFYVGDVVVGSGWIRFAH